MPQNIFPVTLANFDQAFKLPEFPEYYECQACMSIIPDILECPDCSGKACKECADTHAAKHRQQKPGDFPGPTYSKCLLCNKIVLMKNSHKFMKSLLLNLKFYCRGCKQEIPYGKFNQHSSGGRCKPVIGAKTQEQEVVMFNPNQ